jgi:hypothetical protein
MFDHPTPRFTGEEFLVPSHLNIFLLRQVLYQRSSTAQVLSSIADKNVWLTLHGSTLTGGAASWDAKIVHCKIILKASSVHGMIVKILSATIPG